MIELADLANRAQWAQCRDELADELCVTRDVLDTRLAHLHPAERAYLKTKVESGGREGSRSLRGAGGCCAGWVLEQRGRGDGRCDSGGHHAEKRDDADIDDVISNHHRGGWAVGVHRMAEGVKARGSRHVDRDG